MHLIDCTLAASVIFTIGMLVGIRFGKAIAGAEASPVSCEYLLDCYRPRNRVRRHYEGQRG